MKFDQRYRQVTDEADNLSQCEKPDVPILQAVVNAPSAIFEILFQVTFLYLKARNRDFRSFSAS